MMTMNNILKATSVALGLIASASCADRPETSETNPVIENIMSRRSIRKYAPEPVDRKTMEVILDCGINAPNGMNKQSWEVRVVDDPEIMKEIKDAMIEWNPDIEPEIVAGCFRDAPTMVFVANDPSYDCSPIDCGLLSQNIMLSAWSLGVGSVCLGSPVRFIDNAPAAFERLGFSEGYELIICIGLGYPEETPEAKPRDHSKVKFVE